MEFTDEEKLWLQRVSAEVRIIFRPHNALLLLLLLLFRKYPVKADLCMLNNARINEWKLAACAMWWQCSTVLKVIGLNEQFEHWAMSIMSSHYLGTWRKWTHSKGEAILGESKARDWISGPVIPGYGLYTIWTLWSYKLNHCSEKPHPSAKQRLIPMWIITPRGSPLHLFFLVT